MNGAMQRFHRNRDRAMHVQIEDIITLGSGNIVDCNMKAGLVCQV